ncbi:hypothetical protein [Flavobacterium mesophilum]|uniref:hypothetical protein n=1 Tax=Flavobacterium mesophilum TaxID=3143495 RepID=UPI0031D64184
MKSIKIIALAVFLINSTYFFAQQTNTQQKTLELKQKKMDKDFKNLSDQNHKALDTKIAALKSELKEVEGKKKNLVKSENNLKTTISKIEKLQSTNQKLEKNIGTTSLSDEEIIKQCIKNEVNIKKLKLTQITQQKELEKVISTL